MPKITLLKPRVGVLAGYHRIVTEIRDRLDAHAFVGDFIPDGVAVELAIDTIIVEKRDQVEVTKGGRKFEWRVGIVTEDGVLWGRYYDEGRRFASFKCEVKKLLDAIPQRRSYTLSR